MFDARSERRLDAEIIRDGAQSLSVACSAIHRRTKRLPVSPGRTLAGNQQPARILANLPSRIPPTSFTAAVSTRFWKRTVPPPAMSAFDAPDREFCLVRRSRTNTPLQALVLLHDPQFVEAARHLGGRMLAEGGATTRQRLEFGFRLCHSRTPSEPELATLTDVLSGDRLEHYRGDPDAAARLLAVGDSPRTTHSMPPNWPPGPPSDACC